MKIRMIMTALIIAGMFWLNNKTQINLNEFNPDVSLSVIFSQLRGLFIMIPAVFFSAIVLYVTWMGWIKSLLKI